MLHWKNNWTYLEIIETDNLLKDPLAFRMKREWVRKLFEDFWRYFFKASYLQKNRCTKNEEILNEKLQFLCSGSPLLVSQPHARIFFEQNQKRNPWEKLFFLLKKKLTKVKWEKIHR